MEKIKYSILVIDDHPIIHDGLKTLFATEPDLEIVAAATTSNEAMTQLQTLHPDLVICDLSLSDTDGTYLIQKIHSKYPKLRILVYTMSEETLFAERTVDAGARGFVMKTNPPAILKEAVRSVIAGKLYFSHQLEDQRHKKAAGRCKGQESLLNRLSNREMDIFRLIGEGVDTASISKKLSICRNTVDTHRINIKNKLELKNGKALDHTAFEVITQGKPLEK